MFVPLSISSSPSIRRAPSVIYEEIEATLPIYPMTKHTLFWSCCTSFFRSSPSSRDFFNFSWSFSFNSNAWWESRAWNDETNSLSHYSLFQSSNAVHRPSFSNRSFPISHRRHFPVEVKQLSLITNNHSYSHHQSCILQFFLHPPRHAWPSFCCCPVSSLLHLFLAWSVSLHHHCHQHRDREDWRGGWIWRNEVNSFGNT